MPSMDGTAPAGDLTFYLGRPNPIHPSTHIHGWMNRELPQLPCQKRSRPFPILPYPEAAHDTYPKGPEPGIGPEQQKNWILVEGRKRFVRGVGPRLEADGTQPGL